MTKNIGIISIIFILLFTSCSALDIIEKDSVRAFEDLLDNFQVVDSGEELWKIALPDNSAWFEWGQHGISLIIDASPFISAGLNLNILANGLVCKDSKIYISSLMNLPITENKSPPLEQFQQCIHSLRSSLGYHPEMDHYNISIGNGNMLEWARNIESNEKDVVVVLNPGPFVAAGTKPNSIEGWIYTSVSMHEKGKEVNISVLLKSFNLE